MLNKKHLVTGLLVLTGLMSACAVAPRRYITHTTSAPNAVYISYAEVTGTNYLISTALKTKSHMLRCNIRDDNGVACEPEGAIGDLLNPGDR